MAFSIDKARADYYRRLATDDSKPLPRARLGFEPPLTVRAASYHLPGHGLLFCVHGKSYFEPCNQTTCRRTKREADRRLQEFLVKL